MAERKISVKAMHYPLYVKNKSYIIKTVSVYKA